MGWGFKNGNQGFFKSTLIIQANANVTVSVVSSRASYSGTTDENGLLTITVSKKAAYLVTSSVNSTGATINISKSGTVYNIDIVTVNALQAFTVDTWQSNTACCYWTAPADLFTGVYIRRGTSGYPSLQSDNEVYRGIGESLALTASQTVTGTTDAGLTAATTYYYSAWSYLTVNGKTYYSAPLTATYTAVSLINTVIQIKTTQNWIVPVGWRSVKIFCVGGGGSGSAHENPSPAGGGGGGGYTNTVTVAVIPGASHYASIGAGGSVVGYNGDSGDSYAEVAGNRGGTTSLGALISAAGGFGGVGAVSRGGTVGGAGGSGGGAGSVNEGSGSSGTLTNGKPGGSDGSDGTMSGYTSTGRYYYGGKGQGRTTRAFGESGNTLYAGGGGGGGRDSSGVTSGAGGAGGGGAGGYISYNEETGAGWGTANTGGGGGASTSVGARSGWRQSGAGGSGIILVRCLS